MIITTLCNLIDVLIVSVDVKSRHCITLGCKAHMWPLVVKRQSSSFSVQYTALSKMNSSNTTEDLENLFILFGGLGVGIVGVPTLLLGAIILLALSKDKKGNQALNAVFIAITVTAILTVIPLILFDVSLISGYPTFGRCTPVEYAIRYTLSRILVLLILMFTLLLTIVFYVSVCSTGRSCCGLNVVRGVIIFITLCTVGQGIVSAGVYNATPLKLVTVRGSLCVEIPRDVETLEKVILVASVLFFLIPFALSILFVVLTCWRVLGSVVVMDKRVVRSMFVFLVAMILVNCVTRIAPFVIQVVLLGPAGDQEETFLTVLIGVLVLQFQIPVLLIIILVLNKRVRETFCKLLLKIFCCRRCSVKVSYSNDSNYPVTFGNNAIISSADHMTTVSL